VVNSSCKRVVLLIGARVVRPQQRDRSTLRLIGNHLNDVSQALASCGVLDNGPFVEIWDFDTLGDAAGWSKSWLTGARALRSCLPSLLWAILEAPHGRPALFGIARGGAPKSWPSLAASARAARISLSKTRRSGLRMVRIGSSGSTW
jgi:hypothetical protein